MPTAEQALEDILDKAIEETQEIENKSRENSLTITKLEEARSWNTLDIQRKETD